MPSSVGAAGQARKPAVPGAQPEAVLDVVLFSSGVTGLWRVLQVAPVAEGHSLGPHYRQLVLPHPLLLLFLVPVFEASHRFPGSAQGLGLHAPALLSLHGLPGSAQRGGPKTQDFFSVANPTLLCLFIKLKRENFSNPQHLSYSNVRVSKGRCV